jgi:DNA/RNA-binding protein KIN17
MGKRAEVGTPKYLANAMKSKGLQRLRWYCQVCQKQCRDENGFKCHTQSEGHLRQMLVVGENAGKHIHDYSMQFQSEFVALLSRTCGTERVKANNIYQEYIRDKNHLHMNATRWVTLTGFVGHLAQAGIVKAEDTEKGLFISWIDNSPKALAKAEANMKKERLNKSDEQRERQMIEEQIERSAAHQSQFKVDDEDSSGTTPPAELKREEGEKVKLSLNLKKPAANSPETPNQAPSPPKEEASSSSPSMSAQTPAVDTPSSTPAAQPPKPAAPTNVFKSNIFKAAAKPAPTNVFKAGGSSNPLKGSSVPTTAGVKRPLSVAESLMQEDMERKRRRMERESVRA